MTNFQLYRDASNRLTFDVFECDAKSYPLYCRKIADRFGLTPTNDLVVGLDQMFQEYSLGEQRVELAWDIWSGLIVVARDSNSESLVTSIAEVCSDLWGWN